MSANWLCKHQIVTFFRSTSTVNRSLLCSFSYFVYDAYVDVCAWVYDTVAQWSWGGAFDSYCSSIIKVQKKAVRMLASANVSTHTKPIFKLLNILTFRQLYVY